MLSSPVRGSQLIFRKHTGLQIKSLQSIIIDSKLPMLKKIIRNSLGILSRLPVDGRVEPLLALLNKLVKNNVGSYSTNSMYGRAIAIEGLEDPIYYGLLASIAIDLRNRTGCHPWLLQVRSINGAVGVGLRARLKRSWLVTRLSNAQWTRAHKNLIQGVAYQSCSWQSPLSWARRLVASYEMHRQIQRDGNLAKLQINGVLVGDLVIDSYLRFKPAATINVADPFLRKILGQVLRDLELSQAWFEKEKPLIYLSSYTTYIEHGIPVRVALALDVPVRVFGSLMVFGKRLSIDEPFHTTSGSCYQQIAGRLSESSEELSLAKKMLDARLSGDIDQATYYMKQSAYAVRREDIPYDVSGSAVVFLHDFFDSPHVYADMVFDDFWQWVCCTIETFQEQNIKFFVKPHPNQVDCSVNVVLALQDRYPDLQILPTQITNRQLVNAGIKAGITVYGTVAHELAYMGVPVICCARHPHHTFDFCRTAKNIKTYQAMLKMPFESSLNLDEMRHQALQFYYAHNMHGSADEILLCQKFNEYFSVGADDNAVPTKLSTSLCALREGLAWTNFIESLVDDMEAVA